MGSGTGMGWNSDELMTVTVPRASDSRLDFRSAVKLLVRSWREMGTAMSLMCKKCDAFSWIFPVNIENVTQKLVKSKAETRLWAIDKCHNLRRVRNVTDSDTSATHAEILFA